MYKLALVGALALGSTGCCTALRDALLTQYESEQQSCIDNLEEYDMAKACVEDVRKQWTPVLEAAE